MIECRETKYPFSLFLLFNSFTRKYIAVFISSLYKEISFEFLRLSLFQIYLHYQSSLYSMDVEDETNSLATRSESRDSTEKQSERKKKCRGNRKLQRYRQKLRKQGKMNEAIASSSATSVDQSVLAVPKCKVGSKRGKKSLFLIPSTFLRTRSSLESAIDQ